jgi:hypothetical protein
VGRGAMLGVVVAGGGGGVRCGGEVGRAVGVGRDLGVGVARTPCWLTATQTENSDVSTDLHLPALPALKSD